ncbi:uncharacterized protein G2W53_039152 [Senna tora]|uniref:Uncharacterized protein n=1 Tax=Senna tora TaxID=362788 RepID=A0A834W5V6_9FABA|nr:uncharacterized protein G2W53_039152 [Senna tora]
MEIFKVSHDDSGVPEEAKVAVIDVMMDALGVDRVYSVTWVLCRHCDGTVTRQVEVRRLT